MHLGGAVIVAGDEAVQDLGEEAPLLRAEPAHDAEIDRHQLAVVVDEQVSGMHVGVEEAVAQRVAQEGLDHRAAERLEVEALGFEPGPVVERRRLDPFEREHVARGAGPSPPPARGNPDRPWCSPPSRRARRPRAAGPSRPRPSGARSPTTSISRSRRASAESRSAVRATKVKASRSALKRRSMPGRSTFTATARRASPASELGAVDLRDRGRRDRRTEGGEEVAHRLAERELDRALGLGLRERRHLVLQALEVARERDADHVRARRQELAELHIGGTEPGQRGGQPVGGDLAGRPLDQPRQRERAARRERQRRRVDQGEHALAREHEAGAREAGRDGRARRSPITTASPNAAPRCRRSCAGTRRGGSRPRASSRRTPRAAETGGSIRPGSDRPRRRRPRRGRAPGSR